MSTKYLGTHAGPSTGSPGTQEQQLLPGPREIRRENRRAALRLTTRAVLIFLGWCVVVFVFALLLGA